jgi:FMN phosphatase YigB (HAD superfamily)
MTTSKKIPGISNIIFDLGGVLLNIDYYKTEQAFINLGVTNFNELYSQFHADQFFKSFEKGQVSPHAFIERLRSYKDDLSADDIKSAWNAMLLDFPPGRVDFLISLGKRYRIFLLSNTNEVHYEAFQQIELKITGDPRSLDNCFEKAYFSHDIGLRKPDREIFEFVLQDSNLEAAETLFIDDTLANVEAANALGINGLYLDKPSTIEELLKEY